MKKTKSIEGDPFKTLAGNTRRAICTFLVKRKNPQPVNAIATYVKKTHSATSHQLAELRRSNIVSAAHVGREIHYTLISDTIRAALKHV